VDFGLFLMTFSLFGTLEAPALLFMLGVRPRIVNQGRIRDHVFVARGLWFNLLERSA